jgi:hypothetical protein
MKLALSNMGRAIVEQAKGALRKPQRPFDQLDDAVY